MAESKMNCEFGLVMVRDKKTEMYVKFAKIMVIYQGAFTPKRIKTIENVKKQFNYASIVISDGDFQQHVKKPCVPEFTEEFYEYFKEESKRALEEGNNLLVINSSLSDLEPNKYYLALAQKMQYVVLVVPPFISKKEMDDWPLGSLAKNYSKIGSFIKPQNMFQHLFCGWFLHDVDSSELRHESLLYLEDCIENIPEFKNFFAHQCSRNEDIDSLIDSLSTEETCHLISKHFNLDDRWQDVCYCALKVFSVCVSQNTLDYFHNECVQENYGKMSKLKIYGFIVSPHMIAARVQLNRNQKELWDQTDELEDSPKFKFMPGPFSLMKEAKNNFPEVKINRIRSKCNRTLIQTGTMIRDPLNSPHFGRGRSCHILVGKNEEADPKYIDNDVKFAIRRERKVLECKDDAFQQDLPHCAVKRIGRYWYIYLKEILSVDGFMATYCKAFPFERHAIAK